MSVNDLYAVERSLKNLEGVRAELRDVVMVAAGMVKDKIPGAQIMITEGLRTKERQAKLMASGATRTMNSRHLTGHAIDFAVVLHNELRWDWPLYRKVADIFLDAAEALGIKIVCGADWVKFRDGPHIELDRIRSN